jgi:hypothetical protein
MRDTVVDVLLRNDPSFQSLTKSMFGTTDVDDVREILSGDVSKMMPSVKTASQQFKRVLNVRRNATGALRRVRDSNNQGLKLAVAGAGGAFALTGAKKGNEARINYGYGIPSPQTSYQKSASLRIAKTDEDKHQVFGWASVTHVDGKPVVDRQGDVLDIDEVEKSAYNYVLDSRVGGRQHRRSEDGTAFKASNLIESFVLTDEKARAMEIPDDVQRGWWVGFKIHDDDTWKDVKAGNITGFSVHGTGRRESLNGVFQPMETT